MSKLKSLNINGITLQYEIGGEDDGFTMFYMGVTTKTYRKYLLFGKRLTVDVPNYVFTIWRNIEDNAYTKKQVRGWIEHQLAFIDRQEEINRGEII